MMSKLVLVYLLLPSLTAAQPKCTELSIYDEYQNPNTEAISGSDLPVCATPELQCCTAEYIHDRRDLLTEVMLINLALQLDNNSFFLETITDTIKNYLETVFVPAFLKQVPGREVIGEDTYNAIISPHTTELADNLLIDTAATPSQQFDTAAYFLGLVDEITTALAQNVSNMSNSQEVECTKNMVLEGHIDKDNIDLMTAHMDHIRQALTTLIMIRDWYTDDFYYNLAGFVPRENCIDNFIALTCAECTQNISRLCTPVCAAMVIGCYSPFQDGLRAQFDNLWNVTRQLVATFQSDVTTLAELTRNIFDISLDDSGLLQLADELRTQCNVTSNLGRKRSLERYTRQEDNNGSFVVPALSETIEQLTGTYKYGDSGPIVCHDEFIDSSPTDCWNGQQQVTVSTVNFTDETIQGQGNNPVYSFNVNKLAQQANELGVPVNSFLEGTDLAQVLPQDIIIPSGEPYMIDQATPTPTSATTPKTTSETTPTSTGETTPMPTSETTPDSAGIVCAVSALVSGLAIVSVIQILYI